MRKRFILLREEMPTRILYDQQRLFEGIILNRPGKFPKYVAYPQVMIPVNIVPNAISDLTLIHIFYWGLGVLNAIPA